MRLLLERGLLHLREVRLGVQKEYSPTGTKDPTRSPGSVLCSVFEKANIDRLLKEASSRSQLPRVPWGPGVAILVYVFDFCINHAAVFLVSGMTTWHRYFYALAIEAGIVAALAAIWHVGLPNMGFSRLDRRSVYLIELGMTVIVIRNSIVIQAFGRNSYDLEGVAPLFFAMLFAVIGPVTEEVIFRGLILPGLVKVLGPLGLLVNSLLFVSVHLPRGWQWLVLSIPALVFDLQYYLTGNMWVSLITHVLANAYALLLSI